MHSNKKVKFIIKFADFSCEVSTTDFWRKYFYKNFKNTTLEILPIGQMSKKGVNAKLVINSPKARTVGQSSLDLKIKDTKFYLTLSGDEFFFLPLIRNVVQKIFTHIFYVNSGIVLHASAISLKKRAYVFLGHSGAGKSTIATLSEKYYSAPILADNQIFIKEVKNKYFLYPFPFGSYLASESRPISKYPLGAVCFLKKGKSHKVDIITTAKKFLYFKKHSQAHIPLAQSKKAHYSASFNLRLFQFISSAKIYQITFVKKKGFLEKIDEA